MADYLALLDDLAAEYADLDQLVAGLGDHAWLTPTPASGWDVRDSIAHLAVAEELAATALTDEAAFGQRLAALIADLEGSEAAFVEQGRARPGPEVLEWWRDARGRTLARLQERAPKDRVPWITGPMSAMSFATARLMETWAHGHDVRDGLGVPASATSRLRHIADLGVRTRAFAYAVRDLPVPDGDVRVELSAPDNSSWSWGTSTSQVVRGSALDFCLVVTQRRHPSDTSLAVIGDDACAWIAIAQAFAGPPTDQRAPA